jgi:hypothetical protein
MHISEIDKMIALRFSNEDNYDEDGDQSFAVNFDEINAKDVEVVYNDINKDEESSIKKSIWD